MKAQTEIQAMDCSENAEAKGSNETFVSGYRMGYASARSLASVIAANYDFTAEQLSEALDGLLERYIELVNCGDCGSWNPEKEASVIRARRALQAYREQVEG